MIRPIDTQIIHPQTPIVAAKQQRNNHLPVEQQSQFGDIMKKEVEHKKDTVVEAQDPSNLKADKDASKEMNQKNTSKKRHEKQKDKKDKVQKKSAHKIDIRI